MKVLYVLVVVMGLSLNAYCQTLTSKTMIFDDIKVIDKNELLVMSADTLVFAPNAELTIEGVLEIQSPFIIIAPKVLINGGGTIRIVSPNSISGSDWPDHMPTVIDGNNNRDVQVNIELNNTGNLVLAKLNHSTVVGEGIDSDDFCVGGSFSFMADGVCVELKGNRFVLGKDAVLEHFSPTRMFISNGNINSLVSKWIHANSVFEFPIGIDRGDYSPIIVKPEKDAELFVNVIKQSTKEKDLYFNEKEGGIGRVWSAYASHNVRTTYTFGHSKEDEAGRLRSSDMEIFQYSDANEWKLVTTNYVGDEKHSTRNLASMLAKVPVNYFSKFTKVRSKPMSNDDHVSLKPGESVVIPMLKNDKAGDGKIVIQNTRIVEKPKNGFAELLSSGELSYQAGKSFLGTDSLLYEIVDEYGLTSRSAVFMTVGDGGFYLLSNVLTPNGDGYNDQLVFINKDYLTNLELIIVNRWGDRLYESKNYQNTWDGGGVSGGTYYYIIKGKRKNGEDFYQKGWLLLNK